MENLRICKLIKLECYGKLVNKNHCLDWGPRLSYLSYRGIVSSKLPHRLRGGLWRI